MPIKTLAPLPKKKTAPVINYDDGPHKYWIDGIEVPSVTTILEGCTPKDALPWWGMRVGIAAVIRLLQEEKVSWPFLEEHVYEEILSGVPVNGPRVTRKNKIKVPIEAEVINHRLSTNHIRDDAGDRGTLIHSAVEEIGILDQIPDITKFPPEFQGYIQAIARWWMEQEPEFIRQEVIVGSRKHAYAGRFDLDARFPELGRVLVDFKTSKGVYDQYFEQLRLYELAERELNEWQETIEYDHLLIVHLKPDGNYEHAYGDHVSSKTAIAAARLMHERFADQMRKKAGERAK